MAVLWAVMAAAGVALWAVCFWQFFVRHDGPNWILWLAASIVYVDTAVDYADRMLAALSAP